MAPPVVADRSEFADPERSRIDRAEGARDRDLERFRRLIQSRARDLVGLQVVGYMLSSELTH